MQPFTCVYLLWLGTETEGWNKKHAKAKKQNKKNNQHKPSVSGQATPTLTTQQLQQLPPDLPVPPSSHN